MKKWVFFLPLLLGSVPVFAAYPEQFYVQWENRDRSGMEKTLAGWKESGPKEEGRLAAEGYYFSVLIPRKAPGLSLDSGMENTDGLDPVLLSIEAPPPDPSRFDGLLMSKAVSCWKAALQNDPWRLDVRLSLARLYQDQDDFESQYGLLARTLQISDKGWRNLEWLEGGRLPQRSSRLIPAAMQVFITRCFDRNTEEGDQEARRLARLTLTFYPRQAQAYRSLSVFFVRRQDWPRAVKYLLIANQRAPEDSPILCSIGDILDRLGKKREAGIYYRRVIALHNDGASMERARKQLGLEKE